MEFSQIFNSFVWFISIYCSLLFCFFVNGFSFFDSLLFFGIVAVGWLIYVICVLIAPFGGVTAYGCGNVVVCFLIRRFSHIDFFILSPLSVSIVVIEDYKAVCFGRCMIEFIFFGGGIYWWFIIGCNEFVLLYSVLSGGYTYISSIYAIFYTGFFNTRYFNIFVSSLFFRCFLSICPFPSLSLINTFYHHENG